jgi:hypothetical protein
MLGPQHNQAQKEQKRKQKKESNANTGSSTKTKITRNRYALRRIPHTPSPSKRRISSKTFNKESDDDAVAARTNPRVSPDTRKRLGEGQPTPFKKAR